MNARAIMLARARSPLHGLCSELNNNKGEAAERYPQGHQVCGPPPPAYHQAHCVAWDGDTEQAIVWTRHGWYDIVPYSQLGERH